MNPFQPTNCIDCGNVLEWRTVRNDAGSISEATCSRCGHGYWASVDVIEVKCTCPVEHPITDRTTYTG